MGEVKIGKYEKEREAVPFGSCGMSIRRPVIISNRMHPALHMSDAVVYVVLFAMVPSGAQYAEHVV